MPPSSQADRTPSALVWMRPQAPDSRPTVNADRIVATAIAIADADGLEALSMRRIATEMNSGTTSMYRHVRGKSELIELMVDAVNDSQPRQQKHEDWRAGLAEYARSYRNTLLRHPWLAQQASQRPALGPNVLARYDGILGVVLGATDDIELAVNSVGTVNTYVVGAVSAELADLEAQRRTGMTERQWQNSIGAYVSQVVESGRYPNFNRQITEAENTDFTARFEFGLDCVLTGIDARFSDKQDPNPEP